jgi:hypothetical protein
MCLLSPRPMLTPMSSSVALSEAPWVSRLLKTLPLSCGGGRYLHIVLCLDYLHTRMLCVVWPLWTVLAGCGSGVARAVPLGDLCLKMMEALAMRESMLWPPVTFIHVNSEVIKFHLLHCKQYTNHAWWAKRHCAPTLQTLKLPHS